MPASNKKFWQTKLDKNKTRDRIVNRTLRGLGWRVLRIWQHELKESEKVARRVSKALADR
jgi:DNA mismatch endonuclease (patch repair protein)